MDILNQQIFIYGKLPKEGDFIFKGNNHKINSFLESWSNNYIEQLSLLLPCYKEYWTTAPIWNFCTPQSWLGSYIFGLIINSYDKVGRFFPLCILINFEDIDELSLFLNKSDLVRESTKNNYQNLSLEDLYTLIKEDIIITANQITNDFLHKEIVLNNLKNNKSLWWAKGRKDFFIDEYVAMPKAEDLMKYYGL